MHACTHAHRQTDRQTEREVQLWYNSFNEVAIVQDTNGHMKTSRFCGEVLGVG